MSGPILCSIAALHGRVPHSSRCRCGHCEGHCKCPVSDDEALTALRGLTDWWNLGVPSIGDQKRALIERIRRAEEDSFRELLIGGFRSFMAKTADEGDPEWDLLKPRKQLGGYEDLILGKLYEVEVQTSQALICFRANLINIEPETENYAAVVFTFDNGVSIDDYMDTISFSDAIKTPAPNLLADRLDHVRDELRREVSRIVELHGACPLSERLGVWVGELGEVAGLARREG